MAPAVSLTNSVRPSRLRPAIVLGGTLGLAMLVVLLVSCGVATAGGVHFDPESPAGKEYALPLSQARNEAAGKTGVSKNGSVEPAPLFGEGVTGPGGPGAEGGGRHGRSPDDGNERGDNTGTGKGRAAESSGSKAPNAARGPLLTTTSAHYPVGTGFLLAAVVILAGLGLGFGLRRLSGPRSA